MTERDIPKLAVATEYLDTAIGLFSERKGYLSALHLAAAAEELFGAHLPEAERIFTVSWKAEKDLMSQIGASPADAAARRSVSRWKNDAKHMDAGGSSTLRIDPAYAAEHHIEQALSNFYKLNLRRSAAVWRFEDYKHEQQHLRRSDEAL